MNAVAKWLRILWVFPICLIHVNSTSALPTRHAFVFFAVNDGVETISVQSNPIFMRDDSLSSDLALFLVEVRDAPAGGGSPAFGFVQSPGTLSSEINIFATPIVSDAYWNTHATLYGRFELRDSGGYLDYALEVPFFLRTIDTISFDYAQSRDPFPIDIGGGLPTNPPDYMFTGFDIAATPKGNLLGTNGGADADIRFDVDALGTQADLWVASPPYDGSTPIWDISDGLLDVTITSLSDNPDNVCEAHFNGLDYLGNPALSAQPTLDLHAQPIPAPASLVMVLIATPLLWGSHIRKLRGCRSR